MNKIGRDLNCVEVKPGHVQSRLNMLVVLAYFGQFLEEPRLGGLVTDVGWLVGL